MEFKRQKEEETARFEEYKTNEIKKLKYVGAGRVAEIVGKKEGVGQKELVGGWG